MPLRLPRLALIALALIVAAGVFAFRAWQGPAVEVVRAEATRLKQTVVVSGRVLTPAKVDIGATITGRVQTVKVDEGNQVTAGQILGRAGARGAGCGAGGVATEKAALTRIAQGGATSARHRHANSRAGRRQFSRGRA
jgi:HlyD family secretion protein